ncbi:MAG: DUF4437 domain-containing protein [Pseudomonadota bacterium]
MLAKAVLQIITVALLCAPGASSAAPPPRVLPISEVVFQPLNPARGEASPQAGVLWGDIRNNKSTGAIVRFRDGFSSPPHIHNITYRAVVIEGAVHNDDRQAEPMWMGPGSFWTQPAGEPHITAAKPGQPAMIVLEILQGPYLVRPSDQAFDNGERPINVDATNIIWLSSQDTTWVEGADAQIAFLWGRRQGDGRHGALLRLRSGTSGQLQGAGAPRHTVVIRGPIEFGAAEGGGRAEKLEAGSYFSASGSDEVISCLSNAEADCLVYVSTRGRYRFATATP